MKISSKDAQIIRYKYRYYIDCFEDDLEESFDLLSFKDSNSNSLLHIAAWNGDEDTVLKLLSDGIDVDIIGDMGNTALHYANGSNVVRALLDGGASTNIYNEFGELPRDLGRTD